MERTQKVNGRTDGRPDRRGARHNTTRLRRAYKNWFKAFDCGLKLGQGKLNFVRDIPSHLCLPFCNVWCNSLQWFSRTRDTYQLLLWPWPCSWPEVCVRHTFSLRFKDYICLSLLFFQYWHMICNWQTNEIVIFICHQKFLPGHKSWWFTSQNSNSKQHHFKSKVLNFRAQEAPVAQWGKRGLLI